MTNKIICNNLTKSYRSISARIRIKALTNFNMSVKESELTALIGRNGSGKSTILRILATLIKPSSGTVIINSDTFGSLDIKKDGNKVRKEIGFLSENPYFYSEVSAYNTLLYLARLRGNKDPEKVIQLLNRFKLKKWAHVPINVFSHGMRQRMGIVSTLVSDPSVILLDEPFQGLDTQSVAEIATILREEQTEHMRTILYTTHDPRMVEEADRSIKIETENIGGRNA